MAHPAARRGAGARRAAGDGRALDRDRRLGADRHWRAGSLDGADIEVLEVPGAGHSLELPDWRESLAAQSQVFDRLAEHLGG